MNVNGKTWYLLAFLYIITTSSYAGSWQNNVTIGGFNRVHIYTPDTESEVGQGRALLLVLHGCTQSIDAYLSANLEDAADTYGMVIAVPDAVNKAGFACWSYWQGTKSRTSGDYQNLISLATVLTNDSTYNIDADQVYISGLSSGAAFANTAACLAPDIFAGMGISAGPSIGTSSSGAIGNCEAANVALRCEQYAGSYSDFLNTQIASIAFGDADTTVDQCYNRQNAEGMAEVYGVSELAGSTVITQNGRTADEFLWQDNRVSMLWLNGVDHAWSGGAGASGSYISGNDINYANYLGEYFRDNNARINRNQAPVLSSVIAQVNGDAILISGSVTDVDNAVASVDATLQGTNNNLYQFNTTHVVSGTFSIVTTSLPDALYFIDVNATDIDGAVSDKVSLSVRIGPPPPDTPPVLSELQVSTAAQCATVSGEVVDINQNLTGVTVAFSTGIENATVTGTSFNVEACGLPGGEQTAIVTAIDDTNLNSADSLTFSIDAGIVATLSDHISAGRLDYTNYANCYLEYNANPFKLDEIEVAGNFCEWRDEDASCVGPQLACTSGNNGSNNECVAFSGTNYSHKVAGRAYSTGNFFAPDYFALGSNEPLSGSTWGINELSSNDGQNWNLGPCP